MEDDDPPPFWLQPSSAAIRRRGRTSSFSSPILILSLLVVAASLVLVFLVLPSFHSSSSAPKTPHPKTPPQPHSIKKGWDSLNLVLVLFAVICGFLSRTGSGGRGSDNADSGQTASRTSSLKSNVTPRTPYRSYYYYHGGGGFSEDNHYGGSSSRSQSFNSRIATMRNSFSYPDLRQESAWSSSDIDRRRFYDDTIIDRRGFVDGEHIYGQSGSRRWGDDVDVEEVKNVVEDTAAAGVSAKEGEQVKDVEPPQSQLESPLPSPSPPSPLPLPAIESRRKHMRRMSYEAIPRAWKDDDFGDEMPARPTSTPPPPPPPPRPPPMVYRRDSSEEKNSNRNGKKRGGSASATKEFFQSLGKKKKRRQKSIENFEALLGHPSSSDRHRLTLSPPPPSPPPPPHSVLQNLFSSKKSKNRNRKTAPHSSPPPSPPPKRTSDISKSKRTRNPEPPTTVIEEGNRSPLIPIPPAPPPPPPFRVPEWKFTVVHRDYVRIKSREPSRLNSPDITGYEGENEDDQISEGSLMSSPMSSTTTTPNVKGGDGAMFCPSPDVDTKADKFIARFREGLKLEKMNSWNQRLGTNVRSNLGPPIDH